MSTVENDLDLFGRVDNGRIVEFPVYRLHIKNRSHPIAWYTPAVEEPKPELPPFSTYERNVVLKDTIISVSYTVRAYTLEELLRQLRQYDPTALPGEEVKVVNFADVDPAFVQRIYVLASDYLTNKLIAFAATRGYGSDSVDSFTSLMTYRDSIIDKFKNEAIRAANLRDQAWANFLGYFAKVQGGELPVPTSLSDIDALIPELSWGD